MSGQIPAIGAIGNFQDVKRALDSLRAFLVSNQAIAQLASVRGLVYVDSKGNLSSRSPGIDVQEVGGLVTGSSGESVDAAKYYKITVKGTTIKLAVLS